MDYIDGSILKTKDTDSSDRIIIWITAICRQWDNNAHIALALENILVDGKNIDANNSGIEIGNNVSLKANNCVFRNNRCTDYWNGDGGMIYSEDGEYVDLEFTNCELSGNYALGDGGAIYLAEGENNTLLLRNCCVTGNEAHGNYGGGGGICLLWYCNIIDTEISNKLQVLGVAVFILIRARCTYMVQQKL